MANAAERKSIRRTHRRARLQNIAHCAATGVTTGPVADTTEHNKKTTADRLRKFPLSPA